MSSPKAARRAAAPNAAASLAALLSPARAEASRRNGARSRGPKTPEGKTRSAQNALKHGFRAQKYVVLPDEDGAAFQALEAALMEELAPEGALQTVLAQRVVAATWRLERAERLEAEVFAENHYEGGGLGLALIRDCNRARAFETLLRYRGGTLAEFWRALRTLKALQAEAAEVAAPPRRARAQLEAAPDQAPLEALPNKPEARGCPGETVPTAEDGPAARGTPEAARSARPATGDQESEDRSGAHHSGAPSQSNPKPAGTLARSASHNADAAAIRTGVA